jgi:hypothetical protein
LVARRSRSNSDLGFEFLDQVRRLHVIIQGAGLELADSNPDQLARDVVALGQRMQRLAGGELLSDLPLERGAVGPVLRHGLHPSEASKGVNLDHLTCLPSGAHSRSASKIDPTGDEFGRQRSRLRSWWDCSRGERGCVRGRGVRRFGAWPSIRRSGPRCARSLSLSFVA